MDVFAVPVGRGRHELYSEVPDESTEGDEGRGAMRGPARRFREMLVAAEREGDKSPSGDRSAPGWTRRAGRAILRRVAEAVAEQRLLWHLRRQTQATLVHPDDLTGAQAMSLLRTTLGRDRDRHRYWLAVDGALGAVTGPVFFFVPGPNLVAYYFVFRAVGHYLAWRGARRGLEVVTWETRASVPLARLREALGLQPEQRARCLREVAAELRLQHLAAFVERTALPTR